MRRCLPVDDSPDESEYIESDMDGDLELDTDLTDRSAKDSKPREETKDESWLSYREEYPPEHYLEKLETFDEEEYTKEDYKDSSTRLLDRIEDQWNQ